MTKVPWGRPAPRVADAGTMFVRHSEISISNAGSTYGPMTLVTAL